MRSSYCIIYLSLKPTVKEQISIGLLFTDGEKLHFNYSEVKLKYASRLMNSGESTNFVKNYLAGLKSEISGSKLSSYDYLNYLSNYRNNLITFSKPETINLEVNNDNYKKLFEKFVFEYAEKHLGTGQIIEVALDRTKAQLYPKIESHVNIEKKLTAKDIPTLIFPVHVSFIGKNDAPVTGELIDFNSKEGVLENKISRYISLINAFEQKKEKGTYFIIGKEPETKESLQHETWQRIYESSMMRFIDADETEEISKYIEEHNVIPFLD